MSPLGAAFLDTVELTSKYCDRRLGFVSSRAKIGKFGMAITYHEGKSRSISLSQK